jgi:hypothetical protein
MHHLKYDILAQIEIHSPNGIKRCFDEGINPNEILHGLPLIGHLITNYLRSERFADCINVFETYGLVYEDTFLLTLLKDDGYNFEKCLSSSPDLLNKKYNLPCTFTPLEEASLMHICAEYILINCANILINFGVDLNAKCKIDDNGFGGHTPLFHTVNQYNNYCQPMMHLLIDHGADVNITLKGLIWGKSFQWETYLPDVNLISYTLAGLLPQFQRNQKDIYGTISILMKQKYGIEYTHDNVPNKYLSF